VCDAAGVGRLFVGLKKMRAQRGTYTQPHTLIITFDRTVYTFFLEYNQKSSRGFDFFVRDKTRDVTRMKQHDCRLYFGAPISMGISEFLRMCFSESDSEMGRRSSEQASLSRSEQQIYESSSLIKKDWKFRTRKKI
jgi:hypothetical protein